MAASLLGLLSHQKPIAHDILKLYKRLLDAAEIEMANTHVKDDLEMEIFLSIMDTNFEALHIQESINENEVVVLLEAARHIIDLDRQEALYVSRVSLSENSIGLTIY